MIVAGAGRTHAEQHEARRSSGGGPRGEWWGGTLNRARHRALTVHPHRQPLRRDDKEATAIEELEQQPRLRWHDTTTATAVPNVADIPAAAA